MSKQDRQGVRTPADVEIKYNLGKQLSEIELLLDAHRAAQEKITDTADKLGTDIAELRNEFAHSLTEFWATSQEVKADMEATKKDFQATKQELSQTADDLAADILSLADEIEPLAEWTDGTRSGVAGFVAKANENGATLANLVKWATEESGNVSVAAIKQFVADNYATIASVALVESNASQSIAAIQETATENSAQIEILTRYKNESAETLAGIQTDVSEGLAEIESLAALTTETSEALAGIRQTVRDMDARIDALVALETDPTEALAGISAKVDAANARVDTLASMVGQHGDTVAALRQDVTENYAKQTMVTSLDTKFADSISGLRSEVASNYAKTDQLSSLETAMSQQVAGLRTEVAENYASLGMLAEVTDASGKVTTAAIVAAVNNGLSNVKINANQIEFDGTAMFNQGLANGTTTINGECIKTGRISADFIDVDNLLAGYIKVGDFEDGTTTIKGNSIKSGYIQSTDYGVGAAGMKISLDDGTIHSVAANGYYETTLSGGTIHIKSPMKFHHDIYQDIQLLKFTGFDGETYVLCASGMLGDNTMDFTFTGITVYKEGEEPW